MEWNILGGSSRMALIQAFITMFTLPAGRVRSGLKS